MRVYYANVQGSTCCPFTLGGGSRVPGCCPPGFSCIGDGDCIRINSTRPQPPQTECGPCRMYCMFRHCEAVSPYIVQSCWAVKSCSLVHYRCWLFVSQGGLLFGCESGTTSTAAQFRPGGWHWHLTRHLIQRGKHGHWNLSTRNGPTQRPKR